MNHINRTLNRVLSVFLVTLFLATLLLVTTVAQQEEAVISPDLAGSYVLEIESATFNNTSDGTYDFVFNSSHDNVAWVVNAPEFNGGEDDLLAVMLDWAATPNLSADAVLYLGDDERVSLTLSAPRSLGDGQFGFTAQFEATDDMAILPANVDDATLFIQADYDFVSGIADTIITRRTGSLRGTEQVCIRLPFIGTYCWQVETEDEPTATPMPTVTPYIGG